LRRASALVAAACAIAAAMSTASCDAGRERQLDGIVAQLEATRNADVAIAEHLNEYRAQAAQASSDLGRLAPRDPIRLLAALEKSAPGATIGFDAAAAKVTAAGPAGARGACAGLASIAQQAPALTFVSADVTTTSWTAELRLPPVADRAAAASASPAVAAIPPEGLFTSAREKHQRVQIERLQREIAELQRLTGEVAEYEGESVRLASTIKELDAGKPDLLRGAGVRFGALFCGAGPVLATGHVSMRGDRLVAHGELAPGANAENLRERFHGAWELEKLESRTLDVSSKP
jgi:hypothetical protein